MENRTNKLITFWRKLGKLLESGVPLSHTLETIAKETPDDEFKAVIANLITSIKTGTTMVEELAKLPDWFPISVQDIIRAGELQGTLDKAALNVADGLQDGTFQIKDQPQQSLDITLDTDAECALKTIGQILQKAIEHRASDVHFEPFNDRIRIRYRIDGILQEMESLPKEIEESVLTRIKIMANLDPREKNLLKDGRMHINVQGQALDIRVSIAPYITGESAVMRVLNRQNTIIGLDQTGFTEANCKRVKNWCRKHSGLIIIPGPTGCGKTTTLYGLLREMNDQKHKIVTVEDPVEYQMEGINQLQVNIPKGITFAAALRSQLRQDPDIMASGEIRDLDTAYLLLRAVLTGHLVLTSLHTNDATGAISRCSRKVIPSFVK